MFIRASPSWSDVSLARAVFVSLLDKGSHFVVKYDRMTLGEFPMPAFRKLSMVQAKGQVTIPSEIRKKLGLKKGDFVSFVETDKGVVIKPAEVIVTESLDELGRALKAKGLTLQQLIDRGREIRGRLIEEEYGLADPKSR
jgi:antitoxin PrlF